MAGEYAMTVCVAGRRPVIRDALAHSRPPLAPSVPRALQAETAAFISHAIDIAGQALGRLRRHGRATDDK
jgi:hypothetical protein